MSRGPRLAAGKLASTIAISSPCPIAAIACSKSGESSGWMPISMVVDLQRIALQLPLTPPWVRPTTISFWMTIVSSSTGSVTMMAAAASGPHASCSKVSTL